MLSWLFGKNLKDVLSETRRVRVNGIKFTIKKVNVLNYLDGSKVLIQSYSEHKTKAASAALATPEKIKEIEKHYKQVIVAGVVEPKLSLVNEEGAICVDDLFIEPETVEALYLKIMSLTYGKKKLNRIRSAARGVSS